MVILKSDNIKSNSDNNKKDNDDKKSLLENINESTIIRTFSSSTIDSNQQFDVTLNVVVIGGKTYHVVEEYIPEGWTVINDNGGATNNLNRLAWYAFSGKPLRNSTIVYTLKAPSTKGSYVFDGVYQFEGDASSITTKGQTTVTVI